MSSNEEVAVKSEVTRLQQRIVELEWVLGRKTLENDILSETIEKTDLATAVASEGRWSVKTVADVLEVSRSNLIDRVEGRKKKRGRY